MACYVYPLLELCMSRVDDFLDLVDNPSRHALTPGDPADDALLALLVHVAFSDGTVDKGELAFLQKVLPGRDAAALEAWLVSVAREPLDIEAVGHALPSVEERWKALRFAARMAWKDGAIQDEERSLLEALVLGLDLPLEAVDRVLHEMQGKGAEVGETRIVDALKGIGWDAVQLASGPLETNLAGVVPVDSNPVVRVGIDSVEVIGIFREGLAAHFLEGPAWLGWDDIVTYTRVPTFGAAVQLHTEQGRTFTLVDSRLRGLGMLLDRIFAAERPDAGDGPVITQVRGD